MPERNHHSEEAQQILGIIPRWIVRRGITVIFVVFVGIFIGCYFIKYPQTVTAPVVITTLNPPADLMSRSTGRIETLYVADGQVVNPGQVLALLYNVADYDHVTQMYDTLKRGMRKPVDEIVREEWIDREYQMGELQGAFSEFRRVCLDYRHYLSSANVERKQTLLRTQIAKNREYYNKLLQQQTTQGKELHYGRLSLSRDSLLFARGIVSQEEYESAIRMHLQRESSNEGFDASLTNTELAILQKEQQLIELDIQQQDEIAQYERTFASGFQQLLTEIEKWQYQYVIASPIAGKVTFTKYWSNNQTIQSGERMAAVIPEESTRIIGRLAIPSTGFGKVAVGQTVNIKLHGFPHMEFGQLKGQITSISEVPDEAGYVAEVDFPAGLTTTYKKDLPLIQQMDGTGEVITRDQRLIERFLQPIRALFDK